MKLLKITSKYFSACIYPGKFSAPILRWMITNKYDEEKIKQICSANHWDIEEIPLPTTD